MGHVGIAVSDTEAVEARGHAYGVVKTKIKDRPWTDWAILKETNEGEIVVPDQAAENPILRRGMKNNSYINAVQVILKGLGFDLGTFGPNHDGIDGDFGEKTEFAVKAFQGSHMLKADGIVGPATWAELEKYSPDDEPEDEPEELIKNPYTFTVPNLTAEQAQAERDRLRAAYGACEMAVG